MIGSLLDVRALAASIRWPFLSARPPRLKLDKWFSQLTFPVFSRLQDDRQRMQTAFQNSFGLLAIITTGVAALVVHAHPMVFVLCLAKNGFLLYRLCRG